MNKIVGIDVGGTNCKMVLLDDSGELREEKLFATQGELGRSAFIENLAAELDPWMRGKEPPIGLGVAVAGLVGNDGVVQEAPNLPDFVGWRPAEEISERLGGIPVVAENDVNAMGYGELYLGAAKGAGNVLLLALGTGVGGAILIDGRLYRGTRGVAAELGHMTLQVDGPECNCGQPGHVESYLGARGIAILAGSRLDGASDEEREPLLEASRGEAELSTKAIASAAAAGDPLSRAILSDVGRLLGLVCASYVNVFNPEVIVIGGGVALCGDLLLGPARKSMKERAMVATQRGVRLVTAELGLSAAAIGAALLARHALDESGETES